MTQIPHSPTPRTPAPAARPSARTAGTTPAATPSPPPRPSGPAARVPKGVGADPNEVPVRTKLWCTLLMVPIASLMSLLQTAFAGLATPTDSPWYAWMVLSTVVALGSGFVLCARTNHPRAVFAVSCVAVLVFPFDSMLALMALSALLARRDGRRLTVRAIAAAAAVAVCCQLRDALRTPEGSLWHAVFAKPNTGSSYGVPIVMLVGEPTVIATAVGGALVATAIAALVGLHIRQSALTRTATAKADAAAHRAQSLRHDLDLQQFADAVAAEAHDTLAHSLSLLALNASALQAGADRLSRSYDDGDGSATDGTRREQAAAIASSARDIRRQAAGALDEAHAVIDTLRHPEQAADLIAPSRETALTRDALGELVDDARAAGMRLDTWIDVRGLSALDEGVGKVAYRVVQEGLTNARRHAPGAPVSLEVGAAPGQGVHIHMGNPVVAVSPGAPERMDGQDVTRTGAGLPGLAARVQQAHGVCAYGVDARRFFQLDVTLPWSERPARG